ncbi:MAG: hypothetical protein OFPII_14760 [Osedax symbiont Rs1]|nr:MAG: hypothetical protein OFPII_14760 [Osedax symbiont Rs1]
MTNNSEKQKQSKIIQQHWASIEGKPLTPAVDLPRRVIKRSKVKFSL